MINSTLDKRVAKNLKRFERAEHDWQKAKVIHSLIHKISEVYTFKVSHNRKFMKNPDNKWIPYRPTLNELEVNTVEDLWCELYLMVEEVAGPIRERKGSNIFDGLLSNQDFDF